MARTIADNLLLKGKKPLEARAQFDTTLSMKEFDERYIPEGFTTYCVETKKTYRFNAANLKDDITGRWREVNEDIYEGYYTKLTPLAEKYAYEAFYTELNYPYAYKKFEENLTLNIGGCSSVRVGNLYGRNLDWLYNEESEFIIHTPHQGGRYATLCSCGQVSKLTDEFVKSGKYASEYVLLPFYCVDGINENSVFINVNVVPTEGNNTNLFIEPTEDMRVEICANMIPRYVLDYCASADEAVEFIQKHMRIYFSKKLQAYGYEPHFMIGDKDKTYIVEFVDNQVSVLSSVPPIMTNFLLTNVNFNADGSVYTPETRGSHSITGENQITPHGAGLERYNLARAGISPTDLRSTMNDLLYRNAYVPVNNIWYSEFVDGPLTLDSSLADFQAKFASAQARYAIRSRDPANPGYGTWQTTHSIVYNIEEQTANVIFQEDVDNEYEVALIAGPSDLPEYDIGKAKFHLAVTEDGQNVEWTDDWPLSDRIKKGLNPDSGEIPPYSISFGVIEDTEGEDSGNIASNVGSIAIGGMNKSVGQFTTAIGVMNTADGMSTFVEGAQNQVIGGSVYGAHAEGVENIARADQAHVEGFRTEASGNASHAEGQSTKAIGGAAHAEGKSGEALGAWSHVEGFATRATHEAAHAEGSETQASGQCSHAEGTQTQATNLNAHAEGNLTEATGSETHAEGYSTKATGQGAHSEGVYTQALAHSAHAEGYYTKATTSYAHAEGDHTEARNQGAHAEGGYTQVLSYYGHTEGSRTKVDSGATAGHAEGFSTRVLYQNGHAEGNGTVAGEDAHAEGFNTLAQGRGSHVEGMNTSATGSFAHAEGTGTTTITSNQHVQGKYNVNDAVGAFADIVGGGEEGARKNIEATTWEGDKRMKGDVYIHCEDDSSGGQKLIAIPENTTNDNDKYLRSFNDASGNPALGWAYAPIRTVHVAALTNNISGLPQGEYKLMIDGTGDTFYCSKKPDTIMLVNGNKSGIHSSSSGTIADVFTHPLFTPLGYNDWVISYDSANTTLTLTTPSTGHPISTTTVPTNSTVEFIVPADGVNGATKLAIDTYVGEFAEPLVANAGTRLAYFYNGTKWEAIKFGSDWDLSDRLAKGVLDSGTVVPGAIVGNQLSGTQQNKAIGAYATAFGARNTASGVGSFVTGYRNEAAGTYSHAEGRLTVASGNAAHSEGTATGANGNYSHAEGDTTVAYGIAGHAEGGNIEQYGKYTHIQGRNNYIIKPAEGQTDIPFADIVGGGSSPVDRWNIEATTWTGDKYLKGDVYIHAEDDSTGGEKLLPIPPYTTADVEKYLSVYKDAAGEAKLEWDDAPLRVVHAASTETNISTLPQGIYILQIDDTGDKYYCHKSANHTVFINGDKSSVYGTSGKIVEALNRPYLSLLEYNDWTVVQDLTQTSTLLLTSPSWAQALYGNDGPPVNTTISFILPSAVSGITKFKVDGWIADVESPLKAAAGKRVVYYYNSSNKWQEVKMNSEWDLSDRLAKGTNAAGQAVSGAIVAGDITRNTANAKDSWAEGLETQATANGAHAEGYSSKATGAYAHAEGIITTALGEASHAEGYESQTYGSAKYAHAEGRLTIVGGTQAHAEGLGTKALGVESHAEGGFTEATMEAAHAEGYLSQATGVHSHAEGKNTQATNESAHSEGQNTQATGESSHAEGQGTQAKQWASHAEGRDTIADGWSSHTEGCGTVVQFNNQHAQGQYNVIDSSNIYADIVGGGDTDEERKNIEATTWTGDKRLKGDVYVHCEDDSTGGQKLIPIPEYDEDDVSKALKVSKNDDDEIELIWADGECEFADRIAKGKTDAGEITAHGLILNDIVNNKASGDYALAEGSYTTASGARSHAEGRKTTASGDDSHAEGTQTQATYNAAHAEGISTRSTGQGSHTEGGQTIAQGNFTHVQGKFNIADTVLNPGSTGHGYSAFADIIGGGTTNSNRKNIEATTWEGDKFLAGDVYVHAAADSTGGQKLIPIPEYTLDDETKVLQVFKNATGDADLKWGESGITEITASLTDDLYGLENGLHYLKIGDERKGLYYLGAGGAYFTNGSRLVYLATYDYMTNTYTTVDQLINQTASMNQDSWVCATKEGYYRLVPTIYSDIERGAIFKENDELSFITQSDAEGPITYLEFAGGGEIQLAEALPDVAAHTRMSFYYHDGKFYEVKTGGDWDLSDRIAKGTGAHSIIFNEVSGDYANVVAASGTNSSAFGTNNKVYGSNAFSVGTNNTVNNDTSFAQGDNNTLSLAGAVAFGRNNVVSGQQAFAVGFSNNITGTRSMALGSSNILAAQAGIALGQSNKVYANFGIAAGFGTTVGTEGQATQSGMGGMAQGGQTQVQANYAHAEGYQTLAKGLGSHAEGQGTIATSSYSHVEGMYNWDDTLGKYIHIVGGGSSAAEADRKSIEGTTYTGDKHLMGDVYIHCDKTLENGTKLIPIPAFTATNVGDALKVYQKSATEVDIRWEESECEFADRINRVSHPDDTLSVLALEIGEIQSNLLIDNDVDSTLFVGRYNSTGSNWGVIEGESNFVGINSTFAHAEGMGNIINSDSEFCHAEGADNEVLSSFVHIEGNANLAANGMSNGSHVEGINNKLYMGDISHVEGSENHVETPDDQYQNGYNHVEGYNNRVKAYGASHIEGSNHQTQYAEGIHVEGRSNTVSPSVAADTFSHTEGTSNTNNGRVAAHIEGTKNTIGTDADTSHVEGQENTALGAKSHIEGANNTISAGTTNHMEGEGNSITNVDGVVNRSHIEGYNNTVEIGNVYHIEGANQSVYSSGYSHIEGRRNNVWTSNYVHMEGYRNYAENAGMAHIEGQVNTASATGVHVEGIGNFAASEYQHVQGKYAEKDYNNTYADIVGGGDNAENLKNIEATTWTGDKKLKGDVYINCNDDSTGGTALGALIGNISYILELYTTGGGV